MRRWKSILISFGLAGVMAAPAAAVDIGEYLSITGFIDNHIRYIDNISTQEEPGGGDITVDNDDMFHGRTRGRLFFDIKPNPFSKAVVAFEYDQIWGDVGDQELPELLGSHHRRLLRVLDGSDCDPAPPCGAGPSGVRGRCNRAGS